MDQLNVEKQGIPTVTIATSAFEELTKSTMEEHGISEMALVVVEHPIAGHNEEATRRKAEEAFPTIVEASTQWQPQGQ